MLRSRLASTSRALTRPARLAAASSLSPTPPSRLLLRLPPSSLPSRLTPTTLLTLTRTFTSTPIRPSSLTSPSLPPTSQSSSSHPQESGFNRLRTLFRKHGWTALVVYLVLSVIDFGLTFLVIYSVGADRVRDAEDWVLDKLQWRRRDGEDGKIKKAVKDRVETWKENHPKMVKEKSVKEKEVAAAKAAKEEGNVTALAPPPPEPTVNDVQKTLPEDKSGYSALATTAVLAYTIHKIGLLPVRLGLTVWVTPRLVKTLQSWGWRVGMAAPAAGKIKTPRVVTPKPAK